MGVILVITNAYSHSTALDGVIQSDIKKKSRFKTVH